MKYIVFFLLTFIGYSQQTPAPKQKKSILITGGMAHLGNGSVIENSVISLVNGKIAFIADANLMKPGKHDTYINASGKHIYPGFIAPNSTLGLVEIDAVRASDDEREIGEFNPHIRSIIAYNTESIVTESVRPNGILLAQITPRGGRISGTSSVVQLDAWNWEDAIIKENDGIFLDWPTSYSYARGRNEPTIEPNKKYDEQLKSIQDYFDNATAYLNGDKSKKDLAFEAMNGLQNGTKNLYIYATNEREIEDIVLLKIKNKLPNVTVVGAFYAYKVASLLKENNISVLLRRVHSLPILEDEDINLPYKNAKILIDNGVLVALENSGSMERMQTRNLPFYAGTCAAWGISKEQALQLITLNTAKILGIDKNYGSLETGKSATLFISEGDALDMKTNVISEAFIDGRQISLESHQTELYKRYKEKFKREQ
jgi:hypothetical protein